MNAYEKFFDYVIDVPNDLEKSLSDEGIIFNESSYVKGSLKMYAILSDAKVWKEFAKESDLSIRWHIVGIRKEDQPNNYNTIMKGTSLISEGRIKYSNLINYSHAKIPITPQSQTTEVYQKGEQFRVDLLEQIIKKYNLF